MSSRTNPGSWSRLALSEPPGDLSGFPRIPTGSAPWFRAHQEMGGRDKGCWWFVGHDSDGTPEGRFDLQTPRETCYLADSAQAAVRERIERFIAQREWV